jgi:hypothetical protein
MASIYNPSNSKTNCGFCAIAHALYERGVRKDADQLYEETLARLGVERVNGVDPISRQLIFPEPGLDSMRLPTNYEALGARGHTAASYTITAVADAYQLQNDCTKDYSTDDKAFLPRQFCNFFGGQRGNATIDGFIQLRMTLLGGRATESAVRRFVMSQLGGHSIVGSITSNHYINVYIDGAGRITAYDAQDGREYDGPGFRGRMQTVNLFMRLK